MQIALDANGSVAPTLWVCADRDANWAHALNSQLSSTHPELQIKWVSPGNVQCSLANFVQSALSQRQKLNLYISATSPFYPDMINTLSRFNAPQSNVSEAQGTSPKLMVTSCDGDFIFPQLTPHCFDQLMKGFTPFLSSLLNFKFYQRMPRIQQLELFKAFLLKGKVSLSNTEFAHLNEKILSEFQTAHRSVFNNEGPSIDGEPEIRSFGHLLEKYASQRSRAFDPWGASCLSLPLASTALNINDLWVWCAVRFLSQDTSDDERWGIVAYMKELLWREFFKHRYRSYLQATNIPHHSVFEIRIFWTMVDAIENTHVRRGWKQLMDTGYISNRVRQWLASHWVSHFPQNIDMGIAAFAHYLKDYDAAVNWGNWSYIAGQSGLDPKGGRRFDIESQVLTYDADRSWRERFQI